MILLSTRHRVLLDNGPALSGSAAVGAAVVCRFLTSGRKDFTTGVQVRMRIHLSKVGTDIRKVLV